MIRPAALLLAGLTWATPGRAQPTPDLPAMLECRAAPADYFALRRLAGEGAAAMARAGLAWRPTTAFQAEYALVHPVTVFGTQARVVGLTDNGVLAVVAGVGPAPLASRLRLDTLMDGSTFLANRLVHANDAARVRPGAAAVIPTDLDALFGDKPSAPQAEVEEVTQVVTNLGQRGRTMVGCNYVSSTQSPRLPFPRR